MQSEIRNPQSEILILLVDDTKEVNDASARVLKSAGYEVIQAFSGEECLQIIQSVRPDLVLLDVVMDGLNGIDVCRQIKSTTEGLKHYVILLSGLRTSSDQQSEGLEAGADGYIARPVQNRELLARVQAALRTVKAEKDLREALSQSKHLENELVLLNATKDKFFSIIAHDLRSPMGTFMGYSQILAEEYLSMAPDEIKDISGKMMETSNNLFRLLENLLEWSRMQRGLIDYNPELFPLLPKIKEAVGLVTDPARKKSIEINFNIPENLKVLSDKHMFDTIIRNLVSNAIKFTPGGGKIDVSATVSNDSSVEVIIKDSGIGIPGELLGKLFSLNENTSRKGTDGEPSTGLGLLLCKEFVEKHTGMIWAESEEGKGSKFMFTLPGE